MYPDREWNWQPFGSQAHAQSTEPHQPGVHWVFYLCIPTIPISFKPLDQHHINIIVTKDQVNVFTTSLTQFLFSEDPYFYEVRHYGIVIKKNVLAE